MLVTRGSGALCMLIRAAPWAAGLGGEPRWVVGSMGMGAVLDSGGVNNNQSCERERCAVACFGRRMFRQATCWG
jgi:hypothetical protein